MTLLTVQYLTCLTRSGLTVVCGCSMLTGSGFWALWGISRTFSAMKLWTPLRASTVPCIRQTRSVVPVLRKEVEDKHKWSVAVMCVSEYLVIKFEDLLRTWQKSTYHIKMSWQWKMCLDISQKDPITKLFHASSIYTINRETAERKKRAWLVSHGGGGGGEDSSSMM